jgi:hypothetical protein
MKRYLYRGILLIVSCIAMLLSTGCSRYQYLFIGSSLPQNNLKEYVVDNDTVSIRYNYSEANLRLTVSIYNKLLRPLYIDYLKSAIIINNEQLNGPIYDDTQPGFIAPLSYVRLKSNPVRYEDFDIKDLGESKQVQIGSGKGTKLSFDKNSTPLHFRIIIALTENDDYSAATFYDYSFWLSDIIESGVKPKSVPERQANQSYINTSASTNIWLAYTGVIVVTVLIPLVMLAAIGV